MSVDAISRHEVAVFIAVGPEWVTSHDVAAKADVADRTARMHLVKFARAGMIERANVFPGYRYRCRLGGTSDPREHQFIERLKQGAVIFGLAWP